MRVRIIRSRFLQFIGKSATITDTVIDGDHEAVGIVIDGFGGAFLAQRNQLVIAANEDSASGRKQ